MENSSDKPCNDPEQCFKMLELMLDGQATQEQRDFFDEHIEKCIYCLKEYNLGSEIKGLLQAKTAHKTVPKDLIDTIKAVVSSAS